MKGDFGALALQPAVLCALTRAWLRCAAQVPGAFRLSHGRSADRPGRGRVSHVCVLSRARHGARGSSSRARDAFVREIVCRERTCKGNAPTTRAPGLLEKRQQIVGGAPAPSVVTLDSTSRSHQTAATGIGEKYLELL